MYFVYILRSLIDNSFYVGCTNNCQKRLKEHNDGRSIYTRRKRPWKLEYIESYPTLKLARRRERQIKSWKKRTAIERLIHKGAFV